MRHREWHRRLFAAAGAYNLAWGFVLQGKTLQMPEQKPTPPAPRRRAAR